PSPTDTAGDIFDLNVVSGGSTYSTRQFYIVRPADKTGGVSGDASATIRPFIAADDGAGTYSGTAFGPDIPSNLLSHFDDPAAMNIIGPASGTTLVAGCSCLNQFSTKCLP